MYEIRMQTHAFAVQQVLLCLLLFVLEGWLAFQTLSELLGMQLHQVIPSMTIELVDMLLWHCCSQHAAFGLMISCSPALTRLE